MQGKRRERIERARGQVIGVDQIDARAATPRRIEGREILRHRLDREAAARQAAEPVRGDAVEALGEPSGAVEQLLRRLGIELRIGPQEAFQVRPPTQNDLTSGRQPATRFPSTVSPCALPYLD